MSYSSVRTCSKRPRVETDGTTTTNTTIMFQQSQQSKATHQKPHQRRKYNNNSESKLKRIHSLVATLRDSARTFKEQRDASAASYRALLVEHAALEARLREVLRARVAGDAGNNNGSVGSGSGGGIGVLIEASHSIERSNRDRVDVVQGLCRLASEVEGTARQYHQQHQHHQRGCDERRMRYDTVDNGALDAPMHMGSSPRENSTTTAACDDDTPLDECAAFVGPPSHNTALRRLALEAICKLPEGGAASRNEGEGRREGPKDDASSEAPLALPKNAKTTSDDECQSPGRRRDTTPESECDDGKSATDNRRSASSREIDYETTAAEEHRRRSGHRSALEDECMYLRRVIEQRDADLRRVATAANVDDERRYNTLLSKSAELEIECRRLRWVILDRSENERKSLDSVALLQGQIRFYEKSIQEKEKRIRSLEKEGASKRPSMLTEEDVKKSSQTLADLQASNTSKEMQIRALRSEMGETVGVHKELLAESKAAYREMAEKHLALQDKCMRMEEDFRAAEESVATLEEARRSLEASNQRKEEQIHSLREELMKTTVNLGLLEGACHDKECMSLKQDDHAAKESIATLNEKIQSLEQSNQAKEDQICILKEELQNAKCKSIESATKPTHKEVELVNEDISGAKESIAKLEKKRQFLEASNQLKDKQIHSLKEELEAVEVMCKNLVSAAKLNHDEVQSLKKDARTTKEKMTTLEETRQSLEALNRVKEDKIKNLTKKLKEAARRGKEEPKSSHVMYKELWWKYSALESECKVMESEAIANKEEVQSLKKEARATKEIVQRSNQAKEKQIWSLTEELEKTTRGHKEQLDSSKAVHNQLMENHSVLEATCKNLVNAAKLNHEEVRGARRHLEQSNQAMEKQIRALKEELEDIKRAYEERAPGTSNQAEEKHIQSSTEELENNTKGGKEQLDSSEAVHNGLIENHSVLEATCKTSVNAAKLNYEKVRETRQPPEQSNEAMEKQIHALKEELEETKRAYEELESNHSGLEIMCKNLVNAAKLNHEEVRETRRPLEQLNQAMEKQIHSLKEELEEATHARKELETNRSGLEIMCKNLVSAAKLNHKEVLTLKKEAQATKKTIAALEETKLCLEALNQAKEDQIQSLTKELHEIARGDKEHLDSSNAVQNDLVAKQLALEETWKPLEIPAKLDHQGVPPPKKDDHSTKDSLDTQEESRGILQQSDQNMKMQMPILNNKLYQTSRELEEQLESSKAAHDDLIAKHSALERKCHTLEIAKMLKSEEMESLKKNADSAEKSIATLQKTMGCLEESNQTKENQIQSLKEELEDTARGHEEHLDTSKAAYEELELKHSALEVMKEELEDIARGHKERHDSLKAAYEELERKHSVLEDTCKNLDSMAKQKSEEVESLKNDAHASKESTATLEKTRKSLEQSKGMYEKQIQTLKEELDDIARGYNERLDSSKAAYEELALKHSALENKWKKLDSEAKLKHEEVESLEQNLNAAKKRITTLEKTRRSFEELIQTEEEHSHTLKEELDVISLKHRKQLTSSKSLYEELELKHSSLEEKCKNLESAAKLRSEELVSAKALYEKLGSEHSDLKGEYDHLESAAKLKNEEIKALEEETRRFKAKTDSLTKELKEENISLKRGYEQQLLTMNELVTSLQADVKEKVELHKKDQASKDVEIEQLTNNNQDLRSQIDGSRKANENLQSEVNRLLLKTTTLEKSRKDTMIQLENNIETLTQDMESQKKANENLRNQLDEGLKYRKVMQEKIAFLKKKLHQVQVGNETIRSKDTSSNSGSSEIAAPECDVDDWKDDAVVETATKGDNRELPCLASVTMAEINCTELKTGQSANILRSHTTNDIDEANGDTNKMDAENDDSQVPALISTPPADSAIIRATVGTTKPKVDQHDNNPRVHSNNKNTNIEINSSNASSDDGSSNIQNHSSHRDCNIFPLTTTEHELQRDHFETTMSQDVGCDNKDLKANALAVRGKPLLPKVASHADKDVSSSVAVSASKEMGLNKHESKPISNEALVGTQGRSLRKRKSSETIPNEPSAKARAKRSPSQDSKELTGKPSNVKVGDVGYKFKRFFPAHKKWYDGEVIEILGNSMRKCRYIDGIKYYTLRDMKQKCKTRT